MPNECYLDVFKDFLHQAELVQFSVESAMFDKSIVHFY